MFKQNYTYFHTFFTHTYFQKIQITLLEQHEWALLYITSTYFQTKTIHILLKHIEYVTITIFINNLMNIALED